MVSICSKVTTRDVIKDFTSYKLRKSGYENRIEGSQLGFDAPTPVHRLVRDIGDQFETAYFNSFDDMTNQINIHGADLKAVVYSILDSTFDSGIAWGRIVGALVFSARLSVKAQAANRSDVVNNLIQWTTDYLEQPKFDNWINQHNGWNGFTQFYKNPQSRNPTLDGHFNWNKAYNLGLNVINGAATVFNTIMG